MGENTDKVLCPDCGQPVIVPAGESFTKAHKCPKRNVRKKKTATKKKAETTSSSSGTSKNVEAK